MIRSIKKYAPLALVSFAIAACGDDSTTKTETKTETKTVDKEVIKKVALPTQPMALAFAAKGYGDNGEVTFLFDQEVTMKGWNKDTAATKNGFKYFAAVDDGQGLAVKWAATTTGADNIVPLGEGADKTGYSTTWRMTLDGATNLGKGDKLIPKKGMVVSKAGLAADSTAMGKAAFVLAAADSTGADLLAVRYRNKEGGTSAIEKGDTIKLTFKETMDAASLGTVFNIVFADDATTAVINKSATATTDKIATLNFNKNPATGSADLVFQNVPGVWSKSFHGTANDTLTLTLPTKASGTSAKGVAAANGTTASTAKALDLAGVAGGTTAMNATGGFNAEQVAPEIDSIAIKSTNNAISVGDTITITFDEAIDSTSLTDDNEVAIHFELTVANSKYIATIYEKGGSATVPADVIATFSSSAAFSDADITLAANTYTWNEAKTVITITLAAGSYGTATDQSGATLGDGKIGTGVTDNAGNAGNSGQTAVSPSDDF